MDMKRWGGKCLCGLANREELSKNPQHHPLESKPLCDAV